MEKIKRALSSCDTVQRVYVKNGAFGEWLEGAAVAVLFDKPDIRAEREIELGNHANVYWNNVT